MPEGPTPSIPESAAPKPSLSEILNAARESGQQKRTEVAQNQSELKANLLQRVTAARERAKSAWEGIKDFGGKWKSESNRYVDISVGIATNSEARSALGNFMKDKVEDGRDKLNNKYLEIKEKTIQKKDEAVSGFQEKIRGLWRGANEKLVQPQVNRAKEIAKGVKNGGESVVSFFQNQAENTRNGIRAKGAEITAAWNEVLAKPREMRAGLTGSLAEKLMGSANADVARAQERRARAIDHRANAAALRTRNVPPTTGGRG